MTEQEWIRKFEEILARRETESWVEFKLNNAKPQEIGENISALSNAACLADQAFGYILWGVEDKTRKVVGTKFDPYTTKGKGNEDLIPWLARLLNPRVEFVFHSFHYQHQPVVLCQIQATGNTPVEFTGVAYIRIGGSTKSLKHYPEQQRRIWNQRGTDWSEAICEQATIDDLDPAAIHKAREEFKKRNPDKAGEVDRWDERKFLEKARVLKAGARITHTAVILLGKEEATHHLTPNMGEMFWLLKNPDNTDRASKSFFPPFLLNTDRILAQIRNLRYQYLPNRTLFPNEVDQYDPWIIREALHNCIAHQDYSLIGGRIQIVEKPDELIFTNPGSFLPGTIEDVIQRDAPFDRYRNPYLVQAMVSLNMIETRGGGIRKMFLTQRQRCFPMLDYDLSDPTRVVLRISGKILDERYTQLLIHKPDLDLSVVMLLDRVQRKKPISKQEHKTLKTNGLVEGRYPNLFLSSAIRSDPADQTAYILNRAFDKQYYIDMILQYLRKYGSVTRSQIEQLILGKLPDFLTSEQKKNKVTNLLTEISKKRRLIKNTGTRHNSKWELWG